jgi:hypothetical protein
LSWIAATLLANVSVNKGKQTLATTYE